MEGNSDVTSLLFPQAGSGCLPNTLRCSDWDVARQPRHHRCCSASGTQVGAYVDLTLKEQQCWGVEGGLHGKILDWAEAQGARPYLNHHRHQTEGLSRHTGSVRVAKSLPFFFFFLHVCAFSQQRHAFILLTADCISFWCQMLCKTPSERQS